MTIVAAVDRTERAVAIVAEAGRLGEAFGEPVHVVHVLERDEFVALERTNVDETGAAVPVDEVVDMAEEAANEVIAKTDVRAEPVGLMGDPADEIVAYANENDASYIVMGGRKRSPVGKALFGSVVQSVLLNAECPVVSLRIESE